MGPEPGLRGAAVEKLGLKAGLPGLSGPGPGAPWLLGSGTWSRITAAQSLQQYCPLRVKGLCLCFEWEDTPVPDSPFCLKKSAGEYP